jgi:3-phosphoshikimate 1-carboxyvinyltransferase
VRLEGVGMNETRNGFFRALEAMGARLEVSGNGAEDGLEPVGDLRVRYSGRLRGIDLPPEWIPSMIDEVPVLLALAAAADGVTRIRDAAELRVKESDRLAVMARGLAAMGIEVEEYEDGIDVRGGGARSASVHAADDHRCAMSFAVLGLTCEAGARIDGAEYIDTSYPGFIDDLRALGGRLAFEDAA